MTTLTSSDTQMHDLLPEAFKKSLPSTATAQLATLTADREMGTTAISRSMRVCASRGNSSMAR